MATQPTETKIRILAFGDSLTEGYTDFGTAFHPYGPTLQSELQQRLSDKAVAVDVQGRSGDCVLSALGDFDERLRTALNGRKFDYIVMLGGTNDLAYKLRNGIEGAEEIFNDGLKPLYKHVLDHLPAARLIVMTVPERAIDTQESSISRRARANREHLNALIQGWVEDQATRVYMLDLAKKAPQPRSREGEETDEFEGSLWSPDGLHMSRTGYEFVGQVLAELIEQIEKE